MGHVCLNLSVTLNAAGPAPKTTICILRMACSLSEMTIKLTHRQTLKQVACA